MSQIVKKAKTRFGWGKNPHRQRLSKDGQKFSNKFLKTEYILILKIVEQTLTYGKTPKEQAYLYF